MKTSELQGAALDWAVAKCEGRDDIVLVPPEKIICIDGKRRTTHVAYPKDGSLPFAYSTKWAQGGPIIERELYSLQHIQSPDYEWAASADGGNSGYGPTPLIAAMRCYCCAKLGNEVEVPEELTK